MKLSKFLFLLLLIFFLFSFLSPFIFAEERGLEVEYPEIEGEKISTSTTVSEYRVYIFKLSLIIAAIAAFVVLTYGGIRYLLSLNNPEAMKDARTWIFSGVIGLLIILASYLILTTINPEIAIPEIKPIEPVTGIYLINGDEKKYISQSTNGISFEATSLEFISTEDALYSVFICSKEVFDGENSEEIKNVGSGSISSVSNVKSIYFLWNRPGVYLYAKENSGTPPPPRSFQSSSDYLGDFDNRTKSIRIEDVEDQFSYLAILFSDIYFEGEDGIGAAISEKDFNINNVKGSISSIDVSGVIPINEAPADGGEVIFYDDIDCVKKDHSESIKAGSSLGGSSLPQLNKFGKSINFSWPVLSFEIKGNCWVIFNTENNFSGRTEIFKKDGCYPTLKGTYIYHPHPDIKREPKTAVVFYTPD